MQHISIAPCVGVDCVESDDVALVQAAQQNRAAFGLLYQRYVERIYAYLRARTGTAEDAANLTQQVFLQALAALPRYRAGRAPFAAWLFRIARNSAINFQRRRPSTVTWDLVPEALQPIVDDDPAGRLMQQEGFTRLRALFGTLDPATRELLVLRFAAQLSVSDLRSPPSSGRVKERPRCASGAPCIP